MIAIKPILKYNIPPLIISIGNLLIIVFKWYHKNYHNIHFWVWNLPFVQGMLMRFHIWNNLNFQLFAKTYLTGRYTPGLIMGSTCTWEVSRSEVTTDALNLYFINRFFIDVIFNKGFNRIPNAMDVLGALFPSF